MASDFNDEIYSENQNIFAALGFAISNFAQIEFGLLSLFDTLTGLNQKASAALFWSIGSTRNQIKSIDTLVKEVIEDETLISRWNDLKKSLEKAVADRDRLAHGEVICLQRTPEIKDVFFAPRFQKNLGKGSGSGPVEWQPRERLDSDALIQLARTYWLIGRQIGSFWDELNRI